MSSGAATTSRSCATRCCKAVAGRRWDGRCSSSDSSAPCSTGSRGAACAGCSFMFSRLLSLGRLRALIAKEFAQIRRDRRLALSLVLPPVLQLTLFGFALSPTVSNLRLGIVDESQTRESRELVATLTESRSFRVGGYYASADQLGTAISEAR